MISRIIRYIFTLAAIALAVFVVLNSGNYKSFIPEDFNILEMIMPQKDSAEVVTPPQSEVIAPDSVIAADTLAAPLADTLAMPQADTIKVENEK